MTFLSRCRDCRCHVALALRRGGYFYRQSSPRARTACVITWTAWGSNPYFVRFRLARALPYTGRPCYSVVVRPRWARCFRTLPQSGGIAVRVHPLRRQHFTGSRSRLSQSSSPTGASPSLNPATPHCNRSPWAFSGRAFFVVLMGSRPRPKWVPQDLNLRPPRCERGALPTELGTLDRRTSRHPSVMGPSGVLSQLGEAETFTPWLAEQGKH